MDEDNIRQIIVRGILIPSMQKLYRIDYDNIRYGVCERNICARLAHHMENTMRDYDKLGNGEMSFSQYFVDVEYNRMHHGDQKCYENREHRPQVMVSDLLIQRRAEDRNLLAVEMKRKGNYNKAKEDRARLKSMVSLQGYCEEPCVHGTLVGAYIVYSTDDVKVEFFNDIQGTGQSVGEIRFVCINNDDDSDCELSIDYCHINKDEGAWLNYACANLSTSTRQ